MNKWHSASFQVLVILLDIEEMLFLHIVINYYTSLKCGKSKQFYSVQTVHVKCCSEFHFSILYFNEMSISLILYMIIRVFNLNPHPSLIILIQRKLLTDQKFHDALKFQIISSLCLLRL